MIKSEDFGRAFWLDSDNEFCSAPLLTDGTVDSENFDYVTEWTDLEGISLDKLLTIHKNLVIKNYIETTQHFNFRNQIIKESN